MAFPPDKSGDRRPGGPRPIKGTGGKPGPRAGGPKGSGPKGGGKGKPPEPAPSLRKERIAKRLARAGVASRREVERLIGLGRIAVNGRVLDTPATLVSGQDIVTLDGRPVERPEATRVWRFHKTLGLITAAKDPAGRPTVFDALPEGMPRVVKIGRLDINSEGLLLLTNDGELARALELPATGWARRYRARARGRVTQQDLDKLKDGITIDGVRYGPIEATLDKAKEASNDRSPANLWITVTLAEGKNREVRKVLEHLGATVNRLIRLSYGPFQLGTLAEGEVAEVGPRVIREQLASFIHPESLPQGDAVEALPQTPMTKRRVSAMADPSMKPSKIRAHEAKRETLAADQIERNERRAEREREREREDAGGARRDGPGRDRPGGGDRPRGPYKLREGGGDRPRGDGPKREYKPREGGEDRPKRAYTPRDGAGGDKPRGPYKPREGGGDRPRGDGPKREYKPREGGEDRPKRAYTPRPGAGGDKPRGPYKPREGGGDRPRGDGPKREYKSREGGDRPKSGPRPGGKPGGRPGGRPGGGGSGGGRPGGPGKPRGGPR